MAALPVLYVSAVLQAAPGEVAPLSPLKVLQTVQSSVAPPVPGVVATQAVAPVPPPTRAPLPQVNPPATPAAPSQNPVNPAAPVPPLTINPPDLVGEIKLILAPVDVPARQGQVQLQINRWGTAVWNVQNIPALNPLTWATNNNASTFTLTGVQDRALQFEGPDGGLFSYGCRDCAFVVWESGVGLLSASQAPGIVFQVSADGRVLTVTCRAVECRVAGRSSGGVTTVRIRNSENWTFPILRDAATPRVCLGVRADGTPFTEADCPPNADPVTSINFAVVRQ